MTRRQVVAAAYAALYGLSSVAWGLAWHVVVLVVLVAAVAGWAVTAMVEGWQQS